MRNNELVVWSAKSSVVIPKGINRVENIVDYGRQLNRKDQTQIVSGFENEHFEMVSTYVWSKAINALKSQLAKMGASFIAEMLDRPDITEESNIQYVLTDYEAINLAEELGIISGTGAFRLKQAMENINHFTNPYLDDDNENEMTREEALVVLRACIQGVLGYENIDVAIDFKKFRLALEEQILSENNDYVQKLIGSPYFYYRTTLRILLAIVKSSVGAQLETGLANSNVIIPLIWPGLKQPEKWQVGRIYAELFSDGKTTAVSGLKKLLLKVKGFDFVPEDLRSKAFLKIANEILTAHEGMNNFYNEPAKIMTLDKMGSTIPTPAFARCMTAVLSVKLGNTWGISWDAQKYANNILDNVTKDRWIYYFKECLPVDERILSKLTISSALERWIDLVKRIKELHQGFDEVTNMISDKSLKNLIQASLNDNRIKVSTQAMNIIEQLGYNKS